MGGRTWPTKPSMPLDLETGAVVGVTVQDADDGDTETCIETLIDAAEQIETVLTGMPHAPARAHSQPRRGRAEKPAARGRLVVSSGSHWVMSRKEWSIRSMFTGSAGLLYQPNPRCSALHGVAFSDRVRA
jgi:hypothetical protein